MLGLVWRHGYELIEDLVRVFVKMHFIFEDGEVVENARYRLARLSAPAASQRELRPSGRQLEHSERGARVVEDMPSLDVRIGWVGLKNLFVQITRLFIVSKRLKVLRLQNAILLLISRWSRLPSRHHCDHKKGC